MTGQELKDLVASLAVSQKQTDKQLKELGRQIGGLGEKFGSFTEGMALPAMTKILEKKFNLEAVFPHMRRFASDGDCMEIDVLGYANGDKNLVCAVEVKSHLREESLVQMRKLLDKFFSFFPEHRDRSSSAFSPLSIGTRMSRPRLWPRASISPASTTTVSPWPSPKDSSPSTAPLREKRNSRFLKLKAKPLKKECTHIQQRIIRGAQ